MLGLTERHLYPLRERQPGALLELEEPASLIDDIDKAWDGIAKALQMYARKHEEFAPIASILDEKQAAIDGDEGYFLYEADLVPDVSKLIARLDGDELRSCIEATISKAYPWAGFLRRRPTADDVDYVTENIDRLASFFAMAAGHRLSVVLTISP